MLAARQEIHTDSERWEAEGSDGWGNGNTATKKTDNCTYEGLYRAGSEDTIKSSIKNPIQKSYNREHSQVSLKPTESLITEGSRVTLGKNSANTFMSRYVIIGMSAISYLCV